MTQTMSVWFCDKEIMVACFSSVVANLAEVDMTNTKKSKKSIQNIAYAELHDVHKKRYTDYHWSLANDVSFKPQLKTV